MRAKSADVLGRERYERGDGEKAGYRNGYRPGKVKTAEGAVDYSAPQVRDTPEPFISNVRAALSGRTRELERLAVELYVRGLSTRAIEDTFTDETGQTAFVASGGERDHREAVGRVRRLLQARSLRTRGGLPVYRRHRRAAASGPAARSGSGRLGIGEDGRKSLLGLMAGSKEEVETVQAFFQDLRARGCCQTKGSQRLVVVASVHEQPVPLFQ